MNYNFSRHFSKYKIINGNETLFEKRRIKPDVIVRCRRSGVQFMYKISPILKTYKIGKFNVSKAISMMLAIGKMNKDSMHLGAYCISSFSFASKKDKHYFIRFFVVVKVFEIWKIVSSSILKHFKFLFDTSIFNDVRALYVSITFHLKIQV